MTFRKWFLTTACTALVLVAPAAVDAAECGTEGYRWTLRGFGAKVQTDGAPFETSQADPLELTKFKLENGTGLGAELEYRPNCPLGLALGLITADLDSHFMFDSETEWLMGSADVGFDMITLGANFHVSPSSRADFFIGPFIGLIDYDPVSYSFAGQTFDRSLDGDTALGLNAGLDIPFQKNGPWAVTAGLRYMTSTADGNGFEMDVDPLIATAGLAYRWNGGKCGPCEAKDAMDTTTATTAPAVVAPPPPPPPPPPVETAKAAAPPPPPPPPPTEEQEVIHFDTSSARVSNIGKAKLDEVALKLKQDPALVAMVIGHADSSGSDAINDPLSLRRAEAVKSYLVERHGIDPNRITTEGLGSRESVADNGTRAGRAENRRAVIIIKLG